VKFYITFKQSLQLVGGNSLSTDVSGWDRMLHPPLSLVVCFVTKTWKLAHPSHLILNDGDSVYEFQVLFALLPQNI
jgi:hypothetical protein